MAWIVLRERPINTDGSRRGPWVAMLASLTALRTADRNNFFQDVDIENLKLKLAEWQIGSETTNVYGGTFTRGTKFQDDADITYFEGQLETSPGVFTPIVLARVSSMNKDICFINR